MKKISTTLLFLSFAFFASAQFGVIGGMAGAAMAGQKRAHVQKHLFVNANMTFPISLSRSLTGGKLVLPPTYLSVDYGIRDNFTIGAMVGTMTTKTSGTIEGLAQDLLNGDIDLGNLNLLDLQSLLNGGTATSNNYEVKNSSTMLGATFKYNFTGGKNTILYMANRTGLKIRNVKKDYVGTTGDDLVDQVVNTAESTSGIFSSFSFGGYFFLDAKQKWAVNPEIGWGPGWGDGFTITGNPVLLTIGATYHRKPKKPVSPKLR